MTNAVLRAPHDMADSAEAGAADPEPTSPRPRAKKKGVLHYLGLGIGAGVLALLALLAVLVIVVPVVTHSRPLTVLTGSMTPTYPPGTLVVVQPTPAEDIRVGQVMTYQVKSGEAVFITHRVIAKSVDTLGRLTFTTKGDANSLADPPVAKVQVVGTVWYAIPYIGWVNNLVNGDLRPLLIPLVVGALFAYALWMLVSGARDKMRSRSRARSGADS